MNGYLAAVRGVMLESAVDYHRVLTDAGFEPPLARFLVGRAAARGKR
jgi:hypothetical protein